MPDAVAPNITVQELTSFDPACPVVPGQEGEERRRFSPLLVDKSSQRQGASGCVLKARNTTGEQFAIKQALDNAPGVDTERLLFEEYRTLTVVSNLKGFPRIYGWGHVDGRPCIVMEWVEGVTLADAKTELAGTGKTVSGTAVKTLDGRTAAAIGRSVVRTLCAARSLNGGFVHRDLSMRNIMIRTSARSVAEQQAAGVFDVCLIDMGSSSLPAQNSSFTMRAGAWRLGTPAYAPPEMLTCDMPGIEWLRDSLAIDVYALGSILYELYAGKGPFQGVLTGVPSAYRVKMEHQPAELACALPQDRSLVSAIMACLAREQDRRIDAEELKTRLEAYLDTNGSKVMARTDAHGPEARSAAGTVGVAATLPSPVPAGPAPKPAALAVRAARRRKWRTRMASAVIILLALAIAFAVAMAVVAALTVR